MNTVPLLVASAAAVSVWPGTGARTRVHLTDRRRGSRRFGPIWMLAAVPILVAAVVGAGPGLAAAIVAGTGIGLRRRSMRRIGRDRRRDELRRALSFMIAEMSVGAPVVLACRSAADELVRDGPSTVSARLAQLAARAELGGDPADVAADDDAAAHPGEGIGRLASAWAASSSRGLPMVDLLHMLRADLSARADHASRTRAGLAGPRATAMVLGLLPVLGIGLGHLMGAAPLGVLLSPGIGWVLSVVGASLVSAGVWWTDSITAKALR